MEFNDICYDNHADLLYHLAGQVLEHVRSYLEDEEEVSNVVRYYRQNLARAIHRQMQNHSWENEVDYDVKVPERFNTVKSSMCSVRQGEKVRNFRAPVDDRHLIRTMVFDGFKRSLTSTQKFDSDAERCFAVLLEDERSEGLRWFRPNSGQVRIDYRDDQGYEPDFIVETGEAKYMCEVKRESDLQDEEVQAKARAAVRWCQHASDYELQHGGKKWSYLLIPHNSINASATLDGMAAGFSQCE